MMCRHCSEYERDSKECWVSCCSISHIHVHNVTRLNITFALLLPIFCFPFPFPFLLSV